MKKKLIALFITLLIVSLPLAVARTEPADVPAETLYYGKKGANALIDYGKIAKDSITDRLESEIQGYQERYTGEAITINVKAYEPEVVPSSLLGEDDVPIYAYLQGSTLGSALGVKASEGPFYGTPPIKYVTIIPETTPRDYVRSVKYIPPTFRNYILSGRVGYPSKTAYSLDNLGYLIVNLKKFEKEEDLPDAVSINFSAKIFFEAEKGFGFGQQDLILEAEPNEDQWLKKTSMHENQFFAGRGYIRASSIEGGNVKLAVYGGIERLTSASLNKLSSFTLKEGETSDYIVLSQARDLPQNIFRVKLNGVTDPTTRKAKIKLNVDGEVQERILTEGMLLFPESSWRVKYIIRRGEKKEKDLIAEPIDTIKSSVTETIKTGKEIIGMEGETEIIEEVVLTGPEGEVALKKKYLTKSVAEAQTIVDARNIEVNFNEANTINLKSMTLEELKDELTKLVNTENEFPKAYIDLPAELQNLNSKAFKSETKLPLGSVLANTLPSGYGFYIAAEDPERYGIKISDYPNIKEDQLLTVFHITTKSRVQELTQIGKQDPCDNVDVIDFSMGEEQEVRDKVNMATDLQLYCSAIEEFKQVITNYKGVEDDSGTPWEAKAYYNIGLIYKMLNAPLLALENFERAIAFGKGDFITQARYEVEEIKLLIQQGATTEVVTFEDTGRQVQATLIELVGADAAKTPSAMIQIDNGLDREFRVGEDIFESSEEIDGEIYRWKWVLKEVRDTEVIIERREVGKTIPSTIKTRLTGIWKNTEDLDVQRTEVVDSRTLRLSSVKTYKQAFVTIIPGSGRSLISESEFTVHIPIEKRAIKLNTDKIGDKINKTEEQIEKLTKIITKIDDLVKKWKTVCLATFAWLTIKNSLFSGFSRTQARQNALRGVDGQSGWYAYCQANSGIGRLYKTFDKCMIENAGDIDATIDAAQKAVEQINKEFKDGAYKNTAWYGELTSPYNDFEEFGGYAERELFDVQKLRNYRYYNLMSQTAPYQKLSGEPIGKEGLSYNFADEVDRNLKTFSEVNTQQVNNFNTAASSIKENYPNFNELGEDEKKRLFNELYSQATETQNQQTMSEEFKFLTESVTPVSIVKRDGRQMVTNTLGGKVVLQEATVQDYLTWVEGQLSVATPESDRAIALQNEKEKLDKKYKAAGDIGAPLQSAKGIVFKSQDNKLYVALTSAYVTERIREDYAKNAVIEFYPDGKPYCVPTSNGNFVVVKEFYVDNSPKTIQLWNVGADGLLCTTDDVLLKHESVLARNEYEQRTLLTTINKVGSHKEGEVVSVGGKNFLASTTKSRSQQQINKPTCFDTMDPSDCRTLFGVCDPVMCPPSRFNLGGAWPVNNVVATGVIGSLVLGLPNFDLPYEPVPVCLTGISAGLQNIRSILQGYSECLKTAQVSGKSVGICDKIRSIFVCELLWKEALAVFKIHGGMMNLISKKVFGQKGEGGEYLTFQSSLQNIANSVKFFTQDYATTASASYASRSTEEVGTEICKSAIYGKLPSLGNFVDEMSQPESPPQFMALLTVLPYSETQKKSRYQAYYHIYAGAKQKADYTVFLKNAQSQVFYVTDRCGGRIGTIAAGGLADQTMDCVADSGFNEICVSVNGATECGFGKASTNFALNYVNDLVVQDELKRKVKTEEECVPTNSRLSPKLGSLTVPGEFDLVSTGITRVCSITNPGAGTNPSSWQVVGSCDKDAQGHNLGFCWIDLSSVNLNNLEKRQTIMDQIEQQGVNITTSVLGLNLLSEQETKTEYLRIQEELTKDDCDAYIQKIIALKDLVRNTMSQQLGAAAQFEVAELIIKLVDKKCNKQSPKKTEPQITEPEQPTLEDWEKWECRVDGLFNYDSTAFTTPSQEEAKIKDYTEKVKASGKKEVFIYSFASEEGTPKYNQNLSMRRAETAANMLNPLFASEKEEEEISVSFYGLGETTQFNEEGLSKDDNRKINRRYVLSTQELDSFLPAIPRDKMNKIVGCAPAPVFVSEEEAKNAAALNEVSSREKIYLFVKKGKTFGDSEFIKDKAKINVSSTKDLALFVYAKNSKTGEYYDNLFYGIQGDTEGKKINFAISDTDIPHVKKLALQKESTSGNFWLDARKTETSPYTERAVFAWFTLNTPPEKEGEVAETAKPACEECDTFLKDCTYENCLSGTYKTGCYYAKTLFLTFGENCKSCAGQISSCEDYTTKANPDSLRRICKDNPCKVGGSSGCAYIGGACKRA